MDNTQKKLHETLIEILDYVVSVCEKNSLQYCLVYGSALGAYRHHGFIPWDDDMDIAMPRDDYKKFLEVMKKQGNERYSIQNEENEENYFLSFSKVRKNGTIFIESIAEEKYQNNGIYIDVFPLDFIKNYDGKSRRNRNRINYIKHVLKIQGCPKLYKTKEGNARFVVDCVISFPAWVMSNKKLLRNLNKLMVAPINIEQASYIAHYDESSEAAVMEKNIYFPLGECEFEGKMYKVPGNICEYLRRQYGDNYMELPPVEKRATHNPIQLKF